MNGTDQRRDGLRRKIGRVLEALVEHAAVDDEDGGWRHRLLVAELGSLGTGDPPAAADYVMGCTDDETAMSRAELLRLYMALAERLRVATR